MPRYAFNNEPRRLRLTAWVEKNCLMACVAGDVFPFSRRPRSECDASEPTINLSRSSQWNYTQWAISSGHPCRDCLRDYLRDSLRDLPRDAEFPRGWPTSGWPRMGLFWQMFESLEWFYSRCTAKRSGQQLRDSPEGTPMSAIFNSEKWSKALSFPHNLTL
jgi:hypothetical protein